METERKRTLAMRAELYNVASANCTLMFLVALGSNADEYWFRMFAMLCPVGMGIFYGMKARWLEHPYTRDA